MKSITLILAVTVVLAFALPLFAEEGGACIHACQPGKFEMVHATGMIYCVNCALKAEFGANVDCSKTGHNWAVKVSKAEDYCGEDRANLVGTSIFCLENPAAKGLADLKAGSTTTISGRLYNDLPVMQIEEFKVVENEESGKCDGCPGEGEKKS